MQHGKHRIAVLLDLGPLVPVVRVLDRQLVQVEFVLQLGEFRGVGVLELHPDEAARAAEVGTDLALLDLGEFFSVLVGGAIDQHERQS